MYQGGAWASGKKVDALESGREAFRTQRWSDAFSYFSSADRENAVEPGDLALWAQAAYLLGRDSEGGDLLARAHQAFLGRGDAQLAARCAFWIGFSSMIRGDMAQAGGWLSRCARLLEGRPDCAEKGYLLLPEGYRCFHSGDSVSAEAAFLRAAAVGQRFNESDLLAMALQGQGRALIRQGKIARGLALLDEAMIAVTAGEVSPLNAGAVYCSVLDACGEIFDLRRALEWTAALDKWCASQQDLVPYRGHCLIRRAEVLHLNGAWTDALQWARRAAEWLSGPAPKREAGAAFYQLGEVHRVLGNYDEAEEAYRQAGQFGPCPGPGMAQLRLEQGRVDAANAMIRRLAEEIRSPGPRARILDAYVEIVLAARDLAAARAAAEELEQIASQRPIPFLRALAARSSGAVHLAEGESGRALNRLRESWTLWCELPAPYEAARVRLLVAIACRNLGDEEQAANEFSAARRTFQDLGALPDAARAETLLAGKAEKNGGPLSAREVQVLKLVASGMSNRDIAGRLGISEKTVARHLSNIFTKLDLNSRTAATAYAYNHNLV